MLRVARLSDRTGRYYLADRADELEAALASDRRARWVGGGSDSLGLAGRPQGSDLEAVLSGRQPGTGRPLVRRLGPVGAYDLTFAAPKSASVVFALGSAEQSAEVVRAHLVAVDAALGYVARRAVVVRRDSGQERRLLPVDGLIGAAFTHGVSRAHDPHLHTHVVLANLAHGSDSRWSAIDGRGLFAHARAAGALYDAQLRAELSASMDVHWQQALSGSIEMVGVHPLLVGALSRRRAQIAELGHWRGTADLRSAARTTRQRKAAPPAWADLRADWQRMADDVGVGLERREVDRRPDIAGPSERPAPATVDEYRFAAAVYRVGHGNGGVSRRDVVAAWAGALTDGGPAASVEACVDRLADYGQGAGVGERAIGPGLVTPSGWHIRALGARPATPSLLEAWQRAAHSLDRYRTNWPPDDPRLPLGIPATTGALAKLPARRLAEHLMVSRQLDDVARLLHRAPRGAVRERGR